MPIKPENDIRDRAPVCELHGPWSWIDCWNCDDGYSGHDCGEDCCPCLDPEENVLCDICRGKAGRYVCLTCHPEVLDAEV